MEPALIIVLSGREGTDLPRREPDEVFRLAREEDGAVFEIAVVQRADADGVARGDIFVLFPVVEHERELGVEHGKHLQPVFAVEGEKDLAVAVRREGIPQFLEVPLYGAEAVQLAVAHDFVFAHRKGLHPRGVQPHDSEAVERHIAGGVFSMRLMSGPRETVR